MFGLIYSIASYLGFIGVFGYFAWFSDGLGVPKHIDSGAPTSVALALLVDTGLLLLFGLQHSIMAREGFKRWLTRVVPAHLERATFVLASSLALGAVMWLWRPTTTVLWNVDGLAFALLVGLWVTPHMTLGHLFLSLGMSVYIVVGVHFEERSLARERCSRSSARATVVLERLRQARRLNRLGISVVL